MTTAIVKYQPPDIDAHILAMWILFLSRPSKKLPELDGSFFIGDVGEAAEKTWQRWCPYCIARREA